MPSLLCTLPFGVFSGQHIFHQFRQQTFFFCPHFQQTAFVATKYLFQFFSRPPPPDIKWCVPNLYCTQGLPQQTFFFCPHFQQTAFVATKYLFQFFSRPPPPQISNGASLTCIVPRGYLRGPP